MDGPPYFEGKVYGDLRFDVKKNSKLCESQVKSCFYWKMRRLVFRWTFSRERSAVQCRIPAPRRHRCVAAKGKWVIQTLKSVRPLSSLRDADEAIVQASTGC